MVNLWASNYEYQRTGNSVSSNNFHFVFVPKRRKAVLVGDIAVRKQAIIFELISELGLQLTALEVMPDHVHIFINAPTHESAADIAKWVKGKASRYLRDEFPSLKKLSSLWSPASACGNDGSG